MPGLQILVNLDHRGAVGADPLVGDGAGCLIQIPDALSATGRQGGRRAAARPANTPSPCASCRGTKKRARVAISQFEHFLTVEKQPLLGWRDVPVDTTGLGEAVLAQMPVIRQAFIGRGPNVRDQDAHRAQAAGRSASRPRTRWRSWPPSATCPA